MRKRYKYSYINTYFPGYGNYYSRYFNVPGEIRATGKEREVI